MKKQAVITNGCQSFVPHRSQLKLVLTALAKKKSLFSIKVKCT
jgi:hypothetical protein